MKILYIANDRSDAQAAATALRSIAPDVAVTWASRFDDAVQWVHDNRDLAALVVEAQIEGQNCTSFLKHVRRLGLTVPAVVVAPEEAGPPLQSLKAGADDYIAKKQSLFTDLPDVVSRLIERAQTRADLATVRPLRLLYIGDAALARECLENIPYSIEIAEAVPGADGTFQPIPPELPAESAPLSFDVLLVEHDHPGMDVFAILKDLASRRLQIPVVLVVEWDEELAVPALKLGAVDYVVKAKDPLRALFFRLGRGHADAERRQASDMTTSAARIAEQRAHYDAGLAEATESRDALEQKLAETHAALERAERVRASDAAASADQLAQRSQAFTISLAEVIRARDALEQQLNESTLALERNQQERASDAAAASDRLTRRETDLDARLADAAQIRATLELRLGDVEGSLHQREQRWSVERLAAGERQNEFEARLHQEVVNRETVEQNMATARQKLEAAEAALERAENRHASEMTTAAARLVERQAQHDAEKARAADVSEVLEQKLRDAEAALQRQEELRASEATASADLVQRSAELRSRLAQVVRARDTLRQQLSDAEVAVEEARHDHTSAAGDVERLTRREAELAALLTEATATHNTLELRLTSAETARKDADERAARERLAAAEQATQHEAAIEELIHQERATRDNLEQTLAHAEAALQDAEQRHASAMTTAAAQFVQRQARYETRLARADAAWDMVEEQLGEAAAAVKQAQQKQASAVADVDRLARRETELVALLATATATCSTLEQRVAHVENALKDADERATHERLAATERQADLEARLGQEVEKRHALEEELADAEIARQDVEERHASALSTATAQLAERQAQFETELTKAATARDGLNQQLIDAKVAIEEARQHYTSAAADVARLTRREAELGALLAEATATRSTVERRLADTETALKDAGQRATREQLVATERRTDLEARLEREVEKRETLEREIVEVRSASEEAERQFREETAARIESAREQAARFAEQLARERIDQESRLAEMQGQNRHLELERHTLHESLATVHEQLQRLSRAHREERESLEHARQTAEAEVRRLTAEHVEADHKLDEVRRDAQHTLDRISSEHATALATLDALVIDRDETLKEQAARHSASQQAAEHARTQLQDGFSTTVAARSREIEQLQGELKVAVRELDVTRSHREVLKTEADQVPLLQNQLDKSRAEIRRQFEHLPLGLCRCTRDGALTHANPAFAALLGYQTADELRSVDFATTAFESADDLSWLIERCLSTGTMESVESRWRRKDGGRLVVRLSAFASAPDVIEIVAEDLTNVRALQDRLGRAQQMEAVGRLASEVAVTCGNLLGDVSQNGQQWLATLGSNTALQHQGEMLLGEVTRAASFLRQLAAYGDEQTSTLEPVDLRRVLRDLEPVLKRVAGDHIEIVLPKTSSRTSSSLHVDVKAERVERLLVNVANYGRERMPFGGRLIIGLTTVVVDRKFIAKYPNVRQGPHALITVTEVRGAMRSDGPLGLRDKLAEANVARSASDKPGVDLGALQGLLRESGGHLWMKVEPPGDMVVKIHLPLRASDDPAQPRTTVTRTGVGRLMGRSFQH